MSGERGFWIRLAIGLAVLAVGLGSALVIEMIVATMLFSAGLRLRILALAAIPHAVILLGLVTARLLHELRTVIAIQGAITGSIIRNNTITGNRTGIDINNSSSHTIQNNSIENNSNSIGRPFVRSHRKHYLLTLYREQQLH